MAAIESTQLSRSNPIRINEEQSVKLKVTLVCLIAACTLIGLLVGLAISMQHRPISIFYLCKTSLYGMGSGMCACAGSFFIAHCFIHLAEQQKKPKQEQAESQALEPKRLEFPERENVSANFDGNEEEEKANL